MDAELLIVGRSRGRPRKCKSNDVVQRLSKATEQLLKEISHHDLTEKKIAETADTTVAMIHYYFGSKDGLLFAVLVEYFDEMSRRLTALDKVDTKSSNVTRQIVDIIVDAYYSKQWLSSIAMSEFSRNKSSLRMRFIKKFGPQGMGMVRLQNIIDRVIAIGTYDRYLNSTYAAMEMLSLITAPFIMTTLYGGLLAIDPVKNNDWIDHITDLFNRKFLAR